MNMTAVLALADRHFANGENNNQHVARSFHALLTCDFGE
jgi:hypothetical protein